MREPFEAPDIAFFPESDTFGVKSVDFALGVFDPVAGTARRADAAEAKRIWNFPFKEDCAGAAGARGDSNCDNPAWRPDGAFRMSVAWDFAIGPPQSGAAPVINRGIEPLAARLGAGRGATGSTDDDPRITFDWRAGGLEVRTDERSVLRYRLGPPVASEPPSFAATAVCGAEPKPVVIQDAFALYSSYVTAKNQITSTIVCHCRMRGCVKTTLAGMGTPIAATEDGTFVTTATNDTASQSTLTLRAPGHAPVIAKLPGNITYGAFGPRQHFFVARTVDEHEELIELSFPR